MNTLSSTLSIVTRNQIENNDEYNMLDEVYAELVEDLFETRCRYNLTVEQATELRNKILNLLDEYDFEAF